MEIQTLHFKCHSFAHPFGSALALLMAGACEATHPYANQTYTALNYIPELFFTNQC